MTKTTDIRNPILIDAEKVGDRWTAAPDGWRLVEDNRAQPPARRAQPVRDEIPAGTFHDGGDGGDS